MHRRFVVLPAENEGRREGRAGGSSDSFGPAASIALIDCATQIPYRPDRLGFTFPHLPPARGNDATGCRRDFIDCRTNETKQGSAVEGKGANGRRNSERQAQRSFASCIAARWSGTPGGRETYRNLGQGPAISQEYGPLHSRFFQCLLVTAVEMRTHSDILLPSTSQLVVLSLLESSISIRPYTGIVLSVLCCMCITSSNSYYRFRSHLCVTNTGHSHAIFCSAIV